MTKAELIEKIVRSRDLPPDITKKCVQQILELAFAELSAYFVRAKVTRTQSPRFTFPGFGTFTKKKRSARRGVNPRTLEPMTIDAAFTLDFKPGVELRASLNGVAGAKAAQPARKRTPTSPQLELEQAGLEVEPAERAAPAEVEEDDSALILRRRFTAREDIDADELDEEDELDEDTFDEAALEVLRRDEQRGARYDLPPAPMQRAEPPGVRIFSRSGAR